MNKVETLLNMLFLSPSQSYTNPRYEKETMLEHLSENLGQSFGVPIETLEKLLPNFFNKVAGCEESNLESLLDDLDFWMEEHKYVQTEYEENRYDLVFDKMLWSVFDEIDEIVNRCEISIL